MTALGPRRSTLPNAVPGAGVAVPMHRESSREPRQPIGQDFETSCPNAKVIRLEHGRAFARLRAKLGLSREDAAAATDATPKAVRLWEDGESTPRIHQVLFAPRDMSLPLIAWAASKLEHQLHAVPLLRHANDPLRGAEVMAAAGNVLRAIAPFNSGVPLTDDQWGHVHASARRLAEAAMELEARAANELQRRKLRGHR